MDHKIGITSFCAVFVVREEMTVQYAANKRMATRKLGNEDPGLDVIGTTIEV